MCPYLSTWHTIICSFNKSSVAEGIQDIILGNLDAFIYDGTVLDYLVAQDEDCRLLTVGSWYAMTGKISVSLQIHIPHFRIPRDSRVHRN